MKKLLLLLIPILLLSCSKSEGEEPNYTLQCKQIEGVWYSTGHTQLRAGGVLYDLNGYVTYFEITAIDSTVTSNSTYKVINRKLNKLTFPWGEYIVTYSFRIENDTLTLDFISTNRDDGTTLAPHTTEYSRTRPMLINEEEDF